MMPLNDDSLGLKYGHFSVGIHEGFAGQVAIHIYTIAVFEAQNFSGVGYYYSIHKHYIAVFYFHVFGHARKGAFVY